MIDGTEITLTMQAREYWNLRHVISTLRAHSPELDAGQWLADVCDDLTSLLEQQAPILEANAARLHEGTPLNV